ncbi:DUF2332 domain-containing protein [Roseinatronobacter alkalisoli]|uniref:DUF2332 family protein n=1 Tax=Roseinatronobacter alkalisoli TaxID=3028235 RepID=A0ABT5T5E5_9RHOB|nr:DUF2332 family protein [Roseinatronobacter sp. HJB301]MDD7970333.1 DUF2332 family protein [Roseinatronobacter sp. HJB301]
MTFREHARQQAAACAALGSPLTARVLTLIADRLAPGRAVADRLLYWPQNRLRPDAVALRLAGALHYLVLRGQAPILARLYSAPDTVPDLQLWRAIDALLRLHESTILATLDHAPQTNELRRSSVVIAAAHWLTAAFNRPLVLSELGSSAGLNLIWDRYALQVDGADYGPDDAALTLTPKWHGAPPPMAKPIIRARAGVDLNPLDPETDRLRLLSYIWADQRDRLNRTTQALELAATLRPEITRGCAIDWLEQRLSRPLPQALHLVYHTIVWQYLDPDLQERGTAALARAGARLRPDEPMAHLSMEDDGQQPGAKLTLTLWPGGECLDFGRVDFHGAWVDWRAPTLPA